MTGYGEPCGSYDKASRQALAARVLAILRRDAGRTDADLAAMTGASHADLSAVIGVLYRQGRADRCGPYIVAAPGDSGTAAGGIRAIRDIRDIAGQGRHGKSSVTDPSVTTGLSAPADRQIGVTAGAVTLTPARACGARDLLGAALAYARLGWPVFWLGRSKRPVANCTACKDDAHDPAGCGHLTCHGFHAASTDPGRIAAMRRAVPGGLLAIRTGIASGLALIDIDPRNGGQLDPALMLPTAAVATGGGGWPQYYRHPGGPLLPALPGHSGVDVKADGGYAVAPPSVHPGTGRPYGWANDLAADEMPPALRATLTPPSPAPASPAPALTAPPRAAGAGGISDPAALLAAHLRAVQNAPEGTRRRTLYGAARGAARMVLAGAITRADAVAALTAAGHAAQQTPRDIRAAIEGGFIAEGAAL